MFIFLLTCHTNLGRYTCIEIHLALQRNIHLYIQQLYLPSTLVVTLSFIAFWIDYKSHPARTLLSLLTIATITTKSEGRKIIVKSVYLPFLYFLSFRLNIYNTQAFESCTLISFLIIILFSPRAE